MLQKIQFKTLAWLFLFAFALFALACQQPAANTNANTANLNMNANLANMNISNANNAEPMSAIETKEPDQYQATVNLKFQTTGNSQMATPNLQANVARNGENRRLEFAMPNGEKLIYLNTGGRQVVLAPARKQYAVLDREALGFELRNLMMPDQMVDQLANLKGVKRVGDDKFQGRDVIKYAYDATANTQTTAGNVNTESFIYVDKETGLPLRSITQVMSQGNVQGVSGIVAVTEMSNVKTSTEPTMFDIPQDYKEVESEQIRQQVNQVFNVAVAFLSQVMKNAQMNNQTNPSANTNTNTNTNR